MSVIARKSARRQFFEVIASTVCPRSAAGAISPSHTGITRVSTSSNDSLSGMPLTGTPRVAAEARGS